MTPQKFCFRYDGSDEADKALEIVKKKFNKDYYVGLPDVYYYSDVDTNTLNHHCDYTLVPPAEFIRLMKGEENAAATLEPILIEGMGDERYSIIASDGGWVWVKSLSTGGRYVFADVRIRPIRKSLRDEILELLQSYATPKPEIADRIIQLIKERGVEG